MSRIMVSAGHGGGDGGAEGFGHQEAVLALELRDLVVPHLERLGHTVTRDGESGENLHRREAIRRASLAEVAVELHYNGNTPDATGVECFALASNASNRRLASRLATAVAQVMGLRLRGTAGYKPDTETQHGASGLGFCRTGRGVLLEVCFMNERDLTRYLPRKAEVARAIARVLHEHVGGAPEQPDAAAEGGVGSVIGAMVGRMAARTPPRRAVAPGSRSWWERSFGAPQRQNRR